MRAAGYSTRHWVSVLTRGTLRADGEVTPHGPLAQLLATGPLVVDPRVGEVLAGREATDREPALVGRALVRTDDRLLVAAVEEDDALDPRLRLAGLLVDLQRHAHALAVAHAPEADADRDPVRRGRRGRRRWRRGGGRRCGRGLRRRVVGRRDAGRRHRAAALGLNAHRDAHDLAPEVQVGAAR